MVNYGRPSFGCARCRERHKRCDETQPSCRNCEKIGKPCPGLPNKLDLMFKNETATVTRKARKGKEIQNPDDEPGPSQAEPKTSQQQDESQNSGKLVDFSDVLTGAEPESPLGMDFTLVTERTRFPTLAGTSEFVDIEGAIVVTAGENAYLPITSTYTESWSSEVPDFSQLDLMPNLIFNPSVEEQATTFYFSNFVQPRLRQGRTRGFNEVLMPMYYATIHDSPLCLACQAVALRTVANYPARRHLGGRAHQTYVRAVLAAQVAIEDPTRSMSDETLLSILLLSLYESITSEDIKNWSNYVRGAVRIVRARGREHLQSAQSLTLFRATRTYMLTNAVRHSEAIEDFPDPQGWLCDQNGSEAQDANTYLLEHSLRLPSLLSKGQCLFSRSKTAATELQVQVLMEEAYALQTELDAWDLHVPPHFGPKSYVYPPQRSSIPVHANPEHANKLDRSTTPLWLHWPDVPLQTYQDIDIAAIRNNNRVSQLVCTKLILSSLHYLDASNCAEDRRYKAAAYRIQYLVDDIAASVPFCLGFRPAEEENRGPNASDPSGPMQAASRGSGAYQLIYPLTICAQMPEISPRQRAWLRGRLELISKRFGLKQAVQEASTIGGGSEGCGWVPGQTVTV